jgi:plastocyanin
MLRLAAAAGLAAALVLAPASSASRGLPVLTGTVGPGFTIKMSAKTVKPGTYAITIRDLSAFHNFHLWGPGFDRATSVERKQTVTWRVRLRKGIYRYVCDPHATSMKGTLTVVS